MVFPSAKPHACSPGLLRGQSDHKNISLAGSPLGAWRATGNYRPREQGLGAPALLGLLLEKWPQKGSRGLGRALSWSLRPRQLPGASVTFLSPPLPQALGSFPGLIRVRPQPRSGRGKQGGDVTTAPSPAPHPLSPLRWLSVGWRCCFLWLRPKWAVAEDTVAAVYSCPSCAGDSHLQFSHTWLDQRRNLPHGIPV